jgi:Zn-dependent protease with chaperone function
MEGELAHIGAGLAAILQALCATHPLLHRRQQHCSSASLSQKPWGSSRSSSLCC